jgi:hypothetical protein
MYIQMTVWLIEFCTLPYSLIFMYGDEAGDMKSLCYTCFGVIITQFFLWRVVRHLYALICIIDNLSLAHCSLLY